jgi:mRNA interferase MazF
MLRGEVRVADVDPARASEADKRRPAILVSNDHANATAARLGRGVVTVVPVTSNIARVFHFQVALPAQVSGLRVDAKAQCEQVRAVSAQRLGPPLGRLPAAVMSQIDDALRLHLQL